MVADQLRYAGVLEAIRVSRSGYSQRYSFDAFVERYRFIALEELRPVGKDVAKSVDVLVQKVAHLTWQAENPNAAP
jgi:myosin heavy subunit